MDWSKWYFLFVASGVSASKEKAQNQISSGISTTVGATVFNLTLMWGICVIFGTKDMTEKSAAASSSPFKSLKGLSGISFLNLSYWIRMWEIFIGVYAEIYALQKLGLQLTQKQVKQLESCSFPWSH